MNRSISNPLPWIGCAIVALGLACPLVARAQPSEKSPSAQPSPWRGFRIKEPESGAELRIRGLIQSDAVFFLHDRNEQSDRFEIRRGRIALSGKMGAFAFRVEPQFTPGSVVLLDAYLDAQLLGEALALRSGKMKTPLGVELNQPVSALILPERGLSTSLVPNRDIGAQVMGELDQGLFSYAVGVFGGAADGVTPEGNVDDHMDGAGGIWLRPFHALSMPELDQLGVGFAATLGWERGSEDDSGLGRYRTVGRDTYARYQEDALADGRRYRINPQMKWYWQSLGVLAEYVLSVQRVRSPIAVRTLENQAWMAGATYVLTGEDATYGGVTPNHSWGAFELSARYSELYLDEQARARGFVSETTPKLARSWGGSLNYWANAVVRTQLAFERTRFRAWTGTARPAENALLVRFQVSL